MKKRTCPSCEVTLLPIHVLSSHPRAKEPEAHGLLASSLTATAYTVDKPEWNWRNHLKNREGTIQGHLCGKCDQVLFFASPDEV